jgi:hypothetical protein
MLMLLRRIAERIGVALEDRETAALETTTDTAELSEEIDRQMAAVERGDAATPPSPRAARPSNDEPSGR